MKKRLVVAALLALSFTSYPIFAEEPLIQNGIYTQIGFGITDVNSELIIDGAKTTRNQKRAFNTLTLGYDYSRKNWNLASNIFYEKVFLPEISDNQPSSTTKIRFTNIWGLTLEPGYYFDKNLLGYVKLGMVQTRSNYKQGNTNVSFGATHGLLYGLGLKHYFTRDFFVGIEASQINFFSKNVVTASASNISHRLTLNQLAINLGYKF
jgi:opacity protein-like surface antigen